MPVRSRTFPAAITPLVVWCFACVATLPAQETPKLVVPTLASTDSKLGEKVGNELRSRLDDAYDDHELDVVNKRRLRDALESSGIPFESALIPALARQLTRALRADEFINGVVERTSSGVHADITLTLQRDERLVQPLAPADGRDVHDLADTLVHEIRAARKQLPFERQCVSAARDEHYAQAAEAARAGIAAYPRAAIARVCLLTVAAAMGKPADTVAALADELLAIAPTNTIGLEFGARANGELGRSEKAAELWQRLLATAPDDAGIVERVVRGLAAAGQFEAARPVILKAVQDHPDNVPLLQLKWLMLLNAREWRDAIATGLQLEQSGEMHVDADFYARLASAYRANGQPQKALQSVARGVTKYPDDAALYALYAQYVSEEADNAIQRGVQKFPNDARLHLLEAQRLLADGQDTAALGALDRAVALDSNVVGGLVRLAQLRSRLGQDEGAVNALGAALRHGGDSAVVARVALARGNALYRAASASKDRDGLQRALSFLSIASAVRPTPQTHLLAGLSSLSLSQSAATDAPATKSCDLARLAQRSLTTAEIDLPQGGRLAPDAVAQAMRYIGQLEPVVEQQVKAFCTSAG